MRDADPIVIEVPPPADPTLGQQYSGYRTLWECTGAGAGGIFEFINVFDQLSSMTLFRDDWRDAIQGGQLRDVNSMSPPASTRSDSGKLTPNPKP